MPRFFDCQLLSWAASSRRTVCGTKGPRFQERKGTRGGGQTTDRVPRIQELGARRCHAMLNFSCSSLLLSCLLFTYLGERTRMAQGAAGGNGGSYGTATSYTFDAPCTAQKTVAPRRICRGRAETQDGGIWLVDDRSTFEVTLTPALSRSTGRGGRNGSGPPAEEAMANCQWPTKSQRPNDQL